MMEHQGEFVQEWAQQGNALSPPADRTCNVMVIAGSGLDKHL